MSDLALTPIQQAQPFFVMVAHAAHKWWHSGARERSQRWLKSPAGIEYKARFPRDPVTGRDDCPSFIFRGGDGGWEEFLAYLWREYDAAKEQNDRAAWKIRKGIEEPQTAP